MEADPFAEINHECEHSYSQEERLRHRPFCRESEGRFEFSPSVESSRGNRTETPSDGGGCSPLEEFRTPLETLLMSSQEQTVNLAGRVVDDHHKELKARVDVSTEHVGTVDLVKDNDPGFSLEKSPADEGFSFGMEVLVFSRDSSSVRQRISGEILRLQSNKIDGAIAPACGTCVDNVAVKSGDSALMKNIGLLKQKCETVRLQSGVVHGEISVGDSKEESSAEKGKQSEDYQIGPANAAQGVSTSALKATDKDPEIDIRKDTEVRSNAERGSSKKTSKRQSMRENASKDAKGRRELPASIRGLMQNAAKRLVPDSSSSENQSLESLMDAITRLSGEKNATRDLRTGEILETVEQRGMKFSRPRWWPLEGF